jgi:hypothetical protein
MQETPVIDVTDEIRKEVFYSPEGLIRAECKGNNALVFSKISSPVKRFDGQKATYKIEYRWHSPNDVHAVKGNEFTYWMEDEVKEALTGKCLFDCFQLF